jgi:hypothetical protein
MSLWRGACYAQKKIYLYFKELSNSTSPMTQSAYINFLGYLTLKMVAQQTFGTLATLYPTTHQSISQELNLLRIKSNRKDVKK